MPAVVDPPARQVGVPDEDQPVVAGQLLGLVVVVDPLEVRPKSGLLDERMGQQGALEVQGQRPVGHGDFVVGKQVDLVVAFHHRQAAQELQALGVAPGGPQHVAPAGPGAGGPAQHAAQRFSVAVDVGEEDHVGGFSLA